ncbi:hypothetical protein DICSQDRAFT_141696 [Dichomitus squalens LYAD-421 SS1]|uniref:Uncharacterized protein n=1 Tax=Dichomitus squalens (strain LYAD-421) TaxID=732165 RepID=R7SLG6_DICSQ|nr:uncharacterized protein DICSQDRAFT_141696 [Dichomitus squalens LYAD-421 SS1]EJF55887.1 hypothetical protein DICSQDRAFT_141696 [Dichomitus squalens LYAD-421 SS1]
MVSTTSPKTWCARPVRPSGIEPKSSSSELVRRYPLFTGPACPTSLEVSGGASVRWDTLWTDPQIPPETGVIGPVATAVIPDVEDDSLRYNIVHAFTLVNMNSVSVSVNGGSADAYCWTGGHASWRCIDGGRRICCRGKHRRQTRMQLLTTKAMQPVTILLTGTLGLLLLSTTVISESERSTIRCSMQQIGQFLAYWPQARPSMLSRPSGRQSVVVYPGDHARVRCSSPAYPTSGALF